MAGLSLWGRILHLLGFRPPPEKSLFELDAVLAEYVRTVAEREQLRPDELASDLLSSGLAQRDQMQRAGLQWRNLSPREQQVAALACLGYSNQQIASRLIISQETVKTHMTSILRKYGVHNRSELRQVLEGWDFSQWERE